LRRLEEVEQVADLTAELRWVTHQTVPVDDVLVAPAEATALEEAGLDQAATMRWTARSVIPTSTATSHSRTSGSRAMQSKDLRVVGHERPAV
jgi:hypothetical protein